MATFRPLLSADVADSRTRPPELSDDDYVLEVYGYGNGWTEAEYEQELFAKAHSLGVEVPIPGSVTTSEQLASSGTESPATPISQHGRTASTSSSGTMDTGLTSQMSRTSTIIPATLTESVNLASRRRSKSLTFTHYDKYLSQLDPTLHQPKFLGTSAPRPERSANLLFGAGTRKGVRDLKRSITGRLRKRRPTPALAIITCVCCREDFIQEHHDLHTLPCGHTYCRACLSVMISQSTTDESKMPPRCCIQPIPGAIIKTVLTRDEQQVFLKAVLQYSTPWEMRLFCPNHATCGEFIPPRSRVDPKHPFEATCKNCKSRVCIMCKRNAHRLGQDCPEDWELEAVLKIGENSGWRRCYKCRTLVELTQGCTHMTCRCKAQFCYICGAVWDPAVGCPNFCNGEEELERRRMEEEARLAELEAEKQAREEAAAAEEKAKQQADQRTKESAEFKSLREKQEEEMARFRAFKRKTKWNLWTRQSERKQALVDRYSELMEKMKERHTKTEQHLEDRQIEAEIELRSALEQSERSVRIQLKYMEAYCRGLGSTGKMDKDGDSNGMPSREVTQKHLEQLGQQYRVRDGMERRHQAHINVLREKQSKKMEELMERHEKEMDMLADKQAEEVEDLAIEFANEEEAMVHVFSERRSRLIRRWEVNTEILRVEMEKKTGERYGKMPLPEWPSAEEEEEEEDNWPDPKEEDEREEDDDERIFAAAAAGIYLSVVPEAAEAETG